MGTTRHLRRKLSLQSIVGHASLVRVAVLDQTGYGTQGWEFYILIRDPDPKASRNAALQIIKVTPELKQSVIVRHLEETERDFRGSHFQSGVTRKEVFRDTRRSGYSYHQVDH